MKIKKMIKVFDMGFGSFIDLIQNYFQRIYKSISCEMNEVIKSILFKIIANQNDLLT